MKNAKLILLALLFLTSTYALACPNLQGHWLCKPQGDPQKYLLLISQTIMEDTTVYAIQAQHSPFEHTSIEKGPEDFESNPSPILLSHVLADGSEQTHKSMEMVEASGVGDWVNSKTAITCEENALVGTTNIIRSLNPRNVPAQYKGKTVKVLNTIENRVRITNGFLIQDVKVEISTSVEGTVLPGQLHLKQDICTQIK